MPRKDILASLRGGDRRSLGRANQIADLVSKNPRLFPQLIAGLWSEDPILCMRTADAAEKITRNHPRLLQRYKKELLGLMAETQQIELRWHLCAMAVRLTLSSQERQTVITLLHHYLEGRSSIVKTFALQALADLAQDDPEIQSDVIETLRDAVRNGTPAVRARGRKLILSLERTAP
jgi:hypothetical protein